MSDGTRWMLMSDGTCWMLMSDGCCWMFMSSVLVRGGLLSVNFCVYSFLYFVDLILKECDIAQQVFLIIIGNRMVRPVMTMCILITMFESIRLVLGLVICLLMIRRF